MWGLLTELQTFVQGDNSFTKDRESSLWVDVKRHLKYTDFV